MGGFSGAEKSDDRKGKIIVKIKPRDKSHRASASQFFVAGELCRRGFVAVVTLGNCPNTDILCSDVEGKSFVHIQVKTFVPGNQTCSVGMKAEKDYGNRFFWVLGGIPTPDMDKTIEYYVIPSSIMSKNIRAEFQDWVRSPGKRKSHDSNNQVRTVHLPPFKNKRHEWISEYKNRWDLVEEALTSFVDTRLP